MNTILERNRLWAWGLGAAVVTAVIVLSYRTVETERQLSTLQTERESATEEGAQAKSQVEGLGQVAKSLQLKLDNAETEIQRLNQAAANAEARASGYEKQISLLRQGRASCEEFFDGWGIKAAAPPSVVTLFGVAREATAATDCLQKGDVATACKHWEGLLIQIKKIGSPVSDSQAEIQSLIRKHSCKNF